MADWLPLILFVTVFGMILLGYPVAFTIGGLSVLFGLWLFDIQFFYLLNLRIYGTMQNFVLLAVPLFIFMGTVLEKSGIAERMLNTMAHLMGGLRGGLAVAVIIVGAMLAASTGIVGATVVTMGMISLPTMLSQGYRPEISTGVIASSGTLGQIIPPSVVLVLLGSVMNVSVGKLFLAAIVPGMLLVSFYLTYTLIYAYKFPERVPKFSDAERKIFRKKENAKTMWQSFLFPFLLILLVLGAILAGIASPTEAAGVGAFGAVMLTLINGTFSFQMLNKVARETTRLTAMVFMILIGATAFSLVFRGLEGDRLLVSWVTAANFSSSQLLLMIMVLVFIVGFFIDFIEIIFIVVPIVTPLFIVFDIDLIWVGVLLAINLQTSFLTPPFGFALFYLKGVSPKEVKTSHIYHGVVPFVGLQLFLLLLLVIFPQLVTGIFDLF